MKHQQIKKSWSILLLAMLYGHSLLAQNPALQVGEPFDDKTMHHLTILQPEDAFTIQPKKLLVLDFFTTNCGSCIAALPKLNHLQEQYADQVQILTVTSEDRLRVENFMKRNHYAKHSRIPTVVEDSVLRSLFPYRSVPHVVWVLNGRVEAITDGRMLNEESIDELLTNDRANNWPLKNDFFDIQALEFDQENSYTVYSGIGGYVEGAKTAYLVDTLEGQNRKRFRMVNVSIVPAFLKAMGEIRELPLMKSERIILEVDEPHRYERPAEMVPSVWKQQNAFCYEATWPLDMDDKVCYARMIDDLNNKLGVWIRLEQRSVKCWVVTRQEGILLGQQEKQAQSIKIALTLLEIRHRNFPPIMYEGIAEDYKVNLGKVHDFETLNIELGKNGLKMEEKVIPIECVVLSER